MSCTRLGTSLEERTPAPHTPGVRGGSHGARLAAVHSWRGRKGRRKREREGGGGGGRDRGEWRWEGEGRRKSEEEKERFDFRGLIFMR